MAKSKYINIAFNAELLSKITEAATVLYMTRSQYIRYVLAKELNNGSTSETKTSTLEGLFKQLWEED